MHEYLHKYFENIKKTGKKFSIRNMRPLSIREPPPLGRELWGFFLRLCNCMTHERRKTVAWTKRRQRLDISSVRMAIDLSRFAVIYSVGTSIDHLFSYVTCIALFTSRVYHEDIAKLLQHSISYPLQRTESFITSERLDLNLPCQS